MSNSDFDIPLGRAQRLAGKNGESEFSWSGIDRPGLENASPRDGGSYKPLCPPCEPKVGVSGTFR